LVSRGYGALGLCILIVCGESVDVPIRVCVDGDSMKRGPTRLERKYSMSESSTYVVL
jgi:hypothetical protein